MSTNVLKKGMVVYDRSGNKGTITSFDFTNNDDDNIFVQFDDPSPYTVNLGIFSPSVIGKSLFFSIEEVGKKNQKDWGDIRKFMYKCMYIMDDTICLRDYHPVRNRDKITPNPEHDSYSDLISDASKRKSVVAIEEFFQILNNILKGGVVLCVAPSHDPNKEHSGMHILAKQLADNGKIDAISCLVRHTKINRGGKRNVTVHLNSIKVVDRHFIDGKDVLLLDDIITTGNTLKACKQLLLEAGVPKVRALVLGRTTRSD